MSLYLRKNNQTKKLNTMPSNYPADKVSYDDTQTQLGANKVQGAIQALKTLISNLTTVVSGKVSKSGDTMTGTLTVNSSDATQATFCKNHTGTSAQVSDVVIGNNIPEGTQGSSLGRLRLYDATNKLATIRPKSGGLTEDRMFYLPDKSGTVALTSDLDAETWNTSVTGVAYRKIAGHFVEFNMIKSISISTAGTTEVMTLPVGYRPSRIIYTPCVYESSGGIFDSRLLEIYPDGKVYIYSNNLNATYNFHVYLIFAI